MNSRTVALTLSVVAATWSPLAGQVGARDKLSPGWWVGGGVAFASLQSPADFANGLGLNLVGGVTGTGGLGLAGGAMFTVHPTPISLSGGIGALKQLQVAVGPRYTLNPRARTTLYVGARVLGLLRRHTFSNETRRRVGVGGGGVIGITGATEVVRMEFEVAYDQLAFGEEIENGFTSREAFNTQQVLLTLSFVFPLSRR